MNKVVFTILGQPVAKGRPRFRRLPTGAVMAYTPSKTGDYERRVRAVAGRTMDGHPAFSGAVSVRVMVNMEIPQSWSKIKRQQAASGVLLPISRPDLDNIVKAVLDAINGVVFNDDSQITDLILSKRYGPPSVKVIVSKIDGTPYSVQSDAAKDILDSISLASIVNDDGEPHA